MNIGAVLIAAGNGIDPIAPAGSVSVARRMIATLEKSGVTSIAVVTGPEDRKLEKQLTRFGVTFLRNDAPEDTGSSIRLGLGYLADKADRIYLMTADRPALDPGTLIRMRETDAELVIPTHQGKQGLPLLLQSHAAKQVSGEGSIAAICACKHLHSVKLSVSDPGIHLTAADCTDEHYLHHDHAITRPVIELSVCRAKPLLDRKLMALLGMIGETQSVREACSRMQISYSTAWNLLNTAEEALGYPLILRNKGGPSGYGSLLTEQGRKLVTAYRAFEKAAAEAVNKLYDAWLRDIL